MGNQKNYANPFGFLRGKDMLKDVHDCARVRVRMCVCARGSEENAFQSGENSNSSLGIRNCFVCNITLPCNKHDKTSEMFPPPTPLLSPAPRCVQGKEHCAAGARRQGMTSTSKLRQHQDIQPQGMTSMEGVPRFSPRTHRPHPTPQEPNSPLKLQQDSSSLSARVKHVKIF